MKTILFPYTGQPNQKIAQQLAAQDWEIMSLPLQEVRPINEPDVDEDIFQEIATYCWIIFTSEDTVKAFFDIFFKRFRDIRCLGPMQVATFDKDTAEALKKYYIQTDYIAKSNDVQEIGLDLYNMGSLENERVLIVTEGRQRPELANQLEKGAQAIVDSYPVCEEAQVDLENHPVACDFRAHGASAILFDCATTAHAFMKQATHLQISKNAEKPKACSASPEATAAMKKIGMTVDAELEDGALNI